MIDFKKYGGKKRAVDVTDPLKLFESLDVKASHTTLRPAQIEAIQALASRRAERDRVRLHCGDVKRRILRGFPDFSREASGSSVEWHEALPACLTWRALGERSPEESV